MYTDSQGREIIFGLRIEPDNSEVLEMYIDVTKVDEEKMNSSITGNCTEDALNFAAAYDEAEQVLLERNNIEVVEDD